MIRAPFVTPLELLIPIIELVESLFRRKRLLVGEIIGNPAEGVDSLNVRPLLLRQEEGSYGKILVVRFGDACAVSKRLVQRRVCAIR